MTLHTPTPDLEGTSPKRKEEEEDPQEVKTNDIAAINSYVRENHPGPEKTSCDVKHLWSDFYRVNYWKSINSTESILVVYKIVHSIFMTIVKVPDGYFGEVLPEDNTKSIKLKDL